MRAAVAAKDSSSAQPEFGVVWLSARTDVDKMARLVYIQNLQISKVSFPSAPDGGSVPSGSSVARG